MTSILVVDQSVEHAELICDGLRERKYAAAAAASATEALAYLEHKAVDIVVAYADERDPSVLQLVAALRDRQSGVLAIVIASQPSLDTAVAAIRAGAYDFISNPVTPGMLQLAIERAVIYLALRQEVHRLRVAVASTVPIATIVGDSSAIRDVTAAIHRVASSPATVLVTGESGTGKELVARAIHDASDRRHEPFVAINCAALPAALLESELFGHVRGAFTDARQHRHGLFAQAANGTIFLDEIGEMPLDMQVKLLRVLQERVVRPVGGNAEVPFAARLIAATNRDLQTAVEDKLFREDLYYRINVVNIQVPPLRSRPGDLPILASHFIQIVAARARRATPSIGDAALRAMIGYDWPGNIRELQNCIERVMALGARDVIELADLPEAVREHDPSHVVTATGQPDELITLAEVERRYIRQVLAATNNNKSDAARILGIDRRSLYRRLHDEPGATRDN